MDRRAGLRDGRGAHRGDPMAEPFHTQEVAGVRNQPRLLEDLALGSCLRVGGGIHRAEGAKTRCVPDAAQCKRGVGLASRARRAGGATGSCAAGNLTPSGDEGEAV